MQPKKHSMNRPDEIEAYISDYRRRCGVSPTMQEIADHFALNKSTVYKHLKNMERSGRIVSQGTPEEVAQDPDSYTGQYLKKILKRR